MGYGRVGKAKAKASNINSLADSTHAYDFLRFLSFLSSLSQHTHISSSFHLNFWDTMASACGYGDLVKVDYGMATVGLTETLFKRGQICGACFKLHCIKDLRWCITGTSIIITTMNFCASKYGFIAEGGDHCNPPNKHYVLPIEAFENIAIWKARNLPVQYQRRKDGEEERRPIKKRKTAEAKEKKNASYWSHKDLIK